MDLALTNIQMLIRHKTQTTNQASIKQLIVFTQLNGQRVLFLTIQFNVSHYISVTNDLLSEI